MTKKQKEVFETLKRAKARGKAWCHLSGSEILAADALVRKGLLECKLLPVEKGYHRDSTIHFQYEQRCHYRIKDVKDV